MEKFKIDKHEFNETNDHPWADEYDEVLNTMLNQINSFQNRISEMKEKYTEVMEDNYFLSSQLNELVFNKNNHEQCNNHQDPLHGLVNNLLQLMDIASKEKQILMEFCQVILDKMNHLEESLTASPSENKMELSQKCIDDLRIEYSDVIRMLEAQLNSLRAMLMGEREKYKLTAAQAERIEKEYQKVLSEAADAVTKGERAEKNKADMQKEIAKMQVHQQELKDAFQAALSREGVAQDRIEEALNLAEAALHEKDVALLEQKIAKEEVVQMKKTLDELIEDAGIKVKEEIENVKKQFNLRIQEMIGEMTLKDKEMQKLQEELNDCTKKRRILERRLEKMSEMKIRMAGGVNSDTISSANLFEQIARLQAELAQEKEESSNCRREKRLLEDRLKAVVEFQDQQNVIDSLKIELEESKRNQEVLLQLAEKLRDKVAKLESNNLPVKLNERGDKVEQRVNILNTQENILKFTDMQNIMDAQMEMKQRWRDEVSLLTHKLGKRIKELHVEVVKLRAEKKELQKQLKAK